MQNLSGSSSLSRVHEASFEKMRAFRNVYLKPIAEHPVRVLDVGSGTIPGTPSYRDLYAGPDFEYVGLDIEEGPNVDRVPADPFSWGELATESFDVVISGQTFEHNPFFWITAAEIARVLAQDGLVAIIAPSAGHVHRFFRSTAGASTRTAGLPSAPTSGSNWPKASPSGPEETGRSAGLGTGSTR